MTLIKTSLLNAIAVALKMLTLLGINKILALYVGPAGYAALGQFQNAVQMITTFASGAINTGVTKYTAEYFEDEEKQHRVWRTAGSIAFIGSTVTGFLVILYSKPLAGWFLKDESYSGVFVWFAVTLVFFVFNTLLLAILNGKKEIISYVTANIAGSLFALLVTSVMAIKYGLYGALVALAVYQSLTFFVTLFLCYNASWFKVKYIFGEIDKVLAKKLAKYTAMALTSAICIPVSHILIRNHLVGNLGWEAAGYWEAMWRLSAAYLMLVTTTLSVYYLPRLSELKETVEIRHEIVEGYKIILPVAATCGLIIYLMRDFIIRTLFTTEFSGMEVLFAWQMIGDTLKIASWLLGYILIARAFFGLFIASELIFSVLFVTLVSTLTSKYGVEAAAIAHAVNYFLHLMFVFVVLKFKKVI
ncbi:MAG: O-antigen translocase [Paraglaciecola sp.]|nr:O-antigen translocase [Paraglaciecola sp.]